MSDIQCYCETGGGEFADVWVETYHVARKAHACVECRDAINPGERYQRIFSATRGEGASTYKLCAFCSSEWDRLMAKPWREAPEMKLIGDLACHVLNEVREAA